jgi:hypothetical protein
MKKKFKRPPDMKGSHLQLADDRQLCRPSNSGLLTDSTTLFRSVGVGQESTKTHQHDRTFHLYFLCFT